MTVKWVLTGMDLTPSEFAALLVRAMPEDLKKTVPESAAALLERVSKWGLQIAEMGFFRHALVIFHKFCSVDFCHNGEFFLKCYTSLLLSLSFSLPDLLI